MTKTEYTSYEKSVASFLESNQVKPGCYSRKDQEGEGYFAHTACECCGRPRMAGTRLDYSFALLGGGTFEAAICLDCEYYLAYGKLDDMTMMAIEASK